MIRALNDKFDNSFDIKICPIESETEKHTYSDKVKYILNTDCSDSFLELSKNINDSAEIDLVLIQHEFGLFRNNEVAFIKFLKAIKKPIVVVFHTALPNPNELLKINVQQITKAADNIIVMTNCSARVLINDYGISEEKISVIPHGTHLIPHKDKETLKNKYRLSGRKVLSTFGLLSSGKSIETTLNALPAIIKEHPDVLFLIIGKTHPSVVKHEGEKYREMLTAKIEELQLQNHIKFVNHFLTLQDLLEYLQLTDIYLFTSKDPNQAVSGTFSYAISCGCPIISTPIPHSCEVLENNLGYLIDFGNSEQLAEKTISLLNDEQLRNNIGWDGLHRMAPTAWENSAIAHALLFEKICGDRISMHYKIPKINLDHVKKMTNDFGMIQFSVINHPDIGSGYTLDDNARALIAMCMHFELTKDESDLEYIQLYFNFIKYCLLPEGYFLNYVGEDKNFTKQNQHTNLADSNGRAIWSLGYLISMNDLLPKELVEDAISVMQIGLSNADQIYSTRAMAFVIKGIYYRNTKHTSIQNILLMRHFSDRLVQMYKHEANKEWMWFESYLTYANSILPEAMLCAWLATGDIRYKEIAKNSFDFLLSKIFTENSIKVISNKGWFHNSVKSGAEKIGGEQPIDVAYTILTLSKFYDVFKDQQYKEKIEMAFDWFLGKNHLNRIIYNPCTGGCFDGLEEDYINLNQGAESTLSYLMARLSIEKTLKEETGIHVDFYLKSTVFNKN
ncbi:group 1 glycosyl transferase [Flavobacterium enshiense DK69]|nr:group 1 glycosyl transferase [Flavobacterium enshiense DK69]